MKIAVAGVGYVGLSLAVLLSQHDEVYAVSTTPAKVELINSGKSPIKDKEIEEYLASRKLNLTATTDKEGAYRDAEFVVIGEKFFVRRVDRTAADGIDPRGNRYGDGTRDGGFHLVDVRGKAIGNPKDHADPHYPDGARKRSDRGSALLVRDVAERRRKPRSKREGRS